MSSKKRQLFGVLAAIFNEKGEVLLTKRYQPTLALAHGKWQIPGGGVEFEEDPLYALQREVHEETGLYVKILGMIPKVFHNIWHHKTYDSQVFLVGYVCEKISGSIKGTDPESKDPQWVPLDKVDYMNSLPSTKEIIASAYTIWSDYKSKGDL